MRSLENGICRASETASRRLLLSDGSTNLRSRSRDDDEQALPEVGGVAGLRVDPRLPSVERAVMELPLADLHQRDA